MIDLIKSKTRLPLELALPTSNLGRLHKLDQLLVCGAREENRLEDRYIILLRSAKYIVKASLSSIVGLWTALLFMDFIGYAIIDQTSYKMVTPINIAFGLILYSWIGRWGAIITALIFLPFYLFYDENNNRYYQVLISIMFATLFSIIELYSEYTNIYLYNIFFIDKKIDIDVIVSHLTTVACVSIAYFVIFYGRRKPSI